MNTWPQNYSSSEVFFKHAEFSKDGMLRVENLLDAHQFSIRSRRPQPQGRRSSEHKLSVASLSESSPQFDEWINKQKTKFDLQTQGNFDIVHGSRSALPFRHFSTPLQKFLKDFYQKRKYIFNKCTTTQEQEGLRNFLNDFWLGFNLPEEVREELLSFYFKRQNKFRVSVRELVCKKFGTHTFRQLLSCWLEKTGFTVDELIDVDLVGEVMWKLQGLSVNNNIPSK